jgi:hypothetical protein
MVLTPKGKQKIALSRPILPPDRPGESPDQASEECKVDICRRQGVSDFRQLNKSFPSSMPASPYKTRHFSGGRSESSGYLKARECQISGILCEFDVFL